jgi:hypothetical protein
MREPEKLATTASAALRAAAFAAGLKVKMSLVEEKVGDITLVGYRFADDQPESLGEVRNVLPYYSPCFARVGDQFFVCSTLELGRDLVGILKAEKKTRSTDAVNSRIYGAGGAEYFQSFDQVLITQSVLDRAMSVADATAETKAGLALLRSLGPLDVRVRYDAERFNYDFRLKGLK